MAVDDVRVASAPIRIIRGGVAPVRAASVPLRVIRGGVAPVRLPSAPLRVIRGGLAPTRVPSAPLRVIRWTPKLPLDHGFTGWGVPTGWAAPVFGFTDTFDSDPFAGDWTQSGTTLTWDSANDEVDVSTGDNNTSTMTRVESIANAGRCEVDLNITGDWPFGDQWWVRLEWDANNWVRFLHSSDYTTQVEITVGGATSTTTGTGQVSHTTLTIYQEWGPSNVKMGVVGMGDALSITPGSFPVGQAASIQIGVLQGAGSIREIRVTW